jgi:hypothetical protein
VRAEVEDALRRWQEHDRPKDRLIQPGVPLAEAERLVTDFGAELPAEVTCYVAASRNRSFAPRCKTRADCRSQSATFTCLHFIGECTRWLLQFQFADNSLALLSAFNLISAPLPNHVRSSR